MPLFLRIENAMCARPIPNGVRHRLGATLSDVYQRSQRPARLLALVVDAIPELQFVQNELYRNPARVPQALGMIATVLRAQLRAPEAISASDRNERASPVP